MCRNTVLLRFYLGSTPETLFVQGYVHCMHIAQRNNDKCRRKELLRTNGPKVA